MSTLQDIAQNILSLDRLQDNGVPTASIAILKDGKIESHVLTSGFENADTVYQAASISKAICALGVAKLVDDGKLSYDTKVVDHLSPGLVDSIVGESAEARELMQHVTVKMLVSHTSGLSQHGFPGYGGEPASPEDIIRGKHPANTPRMRFISFPSSQCSYSGGGFLILQLMLEKILSKPFPEIMQEVVLTPLCMSRSWYGLELPASETNFARAYSTAYTAAEVERGYNVLPELAAAGLWTTPTDLLKAVSAIQESLYTAAGFLKRETVQLMLTKVYSNNSLGTVGLGWWINDVGFGHGGDNWPGYNASLVGFHDGVNGSRVTGGGDMPRNGIAIMTNSVLGHETCVKQTLGAVMYSLGWSGSKGKDGDIWLPNARDVFVPYSAPASTTIDEHWEEWTGKWEGGWEVVQQADGDPALKFGEFAP